MKKIVSSFLIAIFISSFFLLTASADTFSSQPDETSMYDAYITNLLPNSNFSSQNYICVGEKNDSATICRSVLKFDLSSIPSNAVLSSADLYLYVNADYATNAPSLRVYYLLSSFVENEVTWNNRNTSIAWVDAGLYWSDYYQNAIANSDLSASLAVNSEVALSLYLSTIQGFVDGSLSYNGFFVKMTTENNDAYYFHSSSATTSTYRPKIVIVYSIPGTATPTQTVVITSTFTNTPVDTFTPSPTFTIIPSATNTGTLVATNTYVPTVTPTFTVTSIFTPTSSFTPSPSPTATPGLFYTPVAVSTALYNLLNQTIPVVYGYDNGLIQVLEGVSLGTLIIAAVIISIAFSVFYRIKK